MSIIGLVVEYCLAMAVTRVRFPDDAVFHLTWYTYVYKKRETYVDARKKTVLHGQDKQKILDERNKKEVLCGHHIREALFAEIARSHSSVGQSVRLITVRSAVRARVGPVHSVFVAVQADFPSYLFNHFFHTADKLKLFLSPTTIIPLFALVRATLILLSSSKKLFFVGMENYRKNKQACQSYPKLLPPDRTVEMTITSFSLP